MVAGQYIGFATLIILSIPGFFGGLIIPRPLIGLFGLLPILIGIKCLLNFEDASEENEGETGQNNSFIAKLTRMQVYSVAAVTVANGTDNISIYLPLFASSSWESLLVILGVFFLLVGVLCYAAYKLTHNKAIALVMTGYGNKFMPFVLIGLGAFIVVDSGTLTLLNLFNSEISLSL